MYDSGFDTGRIVAWACYKHHRDTEEKVLGFCDRVLPSYLKGDEWFSGVKDGVAHFFGEVA